MCVSIGRGQAVDAQVQPLLAQRGLAAARPLLVAYQRHRPLPAAAAAVSGRGLRAAAWSHQRRHRGACPGGERAARGSGRGRRAGGVGGDCGQVATKGGERR